MDTFDSGRSHRRRGRHSRRKHPHTTENIAAGRASIGIKAEEHLVHSVNTGVETCSEGSDEEPSKAPTLSIRDKLQRLLNSGEFQAQTQTDLKSLLTAEGAMSTLGSQARAAEYAAATAARARQVSRDAEDQKLPPKVTPVSLCAFSKTPPITRNKGPKAWKPLNMDDIKEDWEDFSAAKTSARTTPVPRTNPLVIDSIHAMEQKRASDHSAPTSGMQTDIPTSPRAMIASQNPAIVVANLTPHRQQPQPIINFSGESFVLEHGNLSSFRGGPPEATELSHFQKFGSMMVPDDISPAKQEEKLAILSRIHSLPRPGVPVYQQKPASVMPHPQFKGDSPVTVFTPDSTHYLAFGGPQLWGAAELDGTYSEYNVEEGLYNMHTANPYQPSGEFMADSFDAYLSPIPALQIAANEHVVPSADVEITNARISEPRLPGSIIHSRQIRSSVPGTLSEPTFPVSPKADQKGEPYDRRSKMQNFVAEATQVALARKGKTVLHNPELHKTPSLKQRKYDLFGSEALPFNKYRVTKPKINRPVPWPVELRDSNVSGKSESTADSSKEGSHVKLPPGLDLLKQKILAEAIGHSGDGIGCSHLKDYRVFGDDPINGAPIDKSLDPIDQVGSYDWAQLRPITHIERDRVRACMARAASSLTTSIDKPGILGNQDDQFNIKTDGRNHTKQWYTKDGRGGEAVRAQTLAIAEKHALLLRAKAAKDSNGNLPRDFKLGLDDGLVTNTLLGEVIANLSTYFIGDRKSVEQRRNFHKVKSVPEFAIERGGLQGAGDSFFDSDHAGFYEAPVRIARDPRFRPQGKEGLKLTPEEEWKNKHEMYGRKFADAYGPWEVLRFGDKTIIDRALSALARGRGPPKS